LKTSLRQPGLSTSFKKVDEGRVPKPFCFQSPGHWCVALGIWWDTRSCVLPDRSPRMCMHPRLPDDWVSGSEVRDFRPQTPSREGQPCRSATGAAPAFHAGLLPSTACA